MMLSHSTQSKIAAEGLLPTPIESFKNIVGFNTCMNIKVAGNYKLKFYPHV